MIYTLQSKGFFHTLKHALSCSSGIFPLLLCIIMRAYTQAYQQNGVSYRVTAKQGYLNVEEMGNIVCEIELTEDSNITSCPLPYYPSFVSIICLSVTVRLIVATPLFQV